MNRDHFKTQIDGNIIEIEIYKANLTSGGCRLYINNECVDSISQFLLCGFTQFSMRYNIQHDNHIVN